jgi:hypothetical protein
MIIGGCDYEGDCMNGNGDFNKKGLSISLGGNTMNNFCTFSLNSAGLFIWNSRKTYFYHTAIDNIACAKAKRTDIGVGTREIIQIYEKDNHISLDFFAPIKYRVAGKPPVRVVIEAFNSKLAELQNQISNEPSIIEKTQKIIDVNTKKVLRFGIFLPIRHALTFASTLIFALILSPIIYASVQAVTHAWEFQKSDYQKPDWCDIPVLEDDERCKSSKYPFGLVKVSSFGTEFDMYLNEWGDLADAVFDD